MLDQPFPSTGFESSAGGALWQLAPYARPVVPSGQAPIDVDSIRGVRTAAGPYVPSTWRVRLPETHIRELVADAVAETAVIEGTSSDVSDLPSLVSGVSLGLSPDLPWIDAFVDREGETAEYEATPDIGELSTDPAVSDGIPLVVEVAATPMEAVASASAVDEWPLDDVGSAIRALADELGVAEHHDDSASVEAPFEPPAATPLPMWGQSDLMDIMPIRAERFAQEESEHWAAQARRETERAGNPEMAALALEALARRVRAGELSIPAFSPDLSDAAALAAALVALLGARG